MTKTLACKRCRDVVRLEFTGMVDLVTQLNALDWDPMGDPLDLHAYWCAPCADLMWAEDDARWRYAEAHRQKHGLPYEEEPTDVRHSEAS